MFDLAACQFGRCPTRSPRAFAAFMPALVRSPRAFAAFMPALVRSEISARSNSASAPIMWNNS